VSNRTPQITNLRSLAESISRQLRAWADSLQNSEIKEQRYLTEKGRREDRRRKDREEMLAELRQITAQGKAEGKSEE
jgi:hypothetical protein